MTYMIVGLGNPGDTYERTRHNAGVLCVDHLRRAEGFSPWVLDKRLKVMSSEGELAQHHAVLLLPQDYMNNSGPVIQKILREHEEYSAERMVVVYDDIDMPLGKLRLSYDRGSGGHRGLESVHGALKSRAFVRLRIGISPRENDEIRKPHGEEAVLSFVMGKISETEMRELELVFEKAARAIASYIADGIDQAMNVYNS